MTTPAEPKLLHVISPTWALRKMRDKARVELRRNDESSCWIRPQGDDRPTFSIGTTLVERHRLRPEFGHLATARLTFKRLRDKLEPCRASSSDKLKLSRAALCNLATFPGNSADLDASHRCGEPRCFAPGHIAWEDHTLNTNRDACFRNLRTTCLHSPSCIRGAVIKRVTVKGTSARPGRRRKGVPPPSAYGGDTPAPETPPPTSTKCSPTNDTPAALPTPPLTPPSTLANQLPSLAGSSRPAGSRGISSSPSSAARLPPASTSSSPSSSRTSRASSELSVVLDSEDEDAWEAFEGQEVEVEKARNEFEERMSYERRRSVEVLDLTGSDDEDVEVVRAEGGGNDAGALVASSAGRDGGRMEGQDEVQRRRKRLFDIVSAELATLERPQKRHRPALPTPLSLVLPAARILRHSQISRMFRAHRPLASWIQAIKSCWRWIK
ncbi:hypothetical protein RTG_02675 [Rhodotorula toruloides ATCC 204091]|uniref:Zinc-binding loop region of homing endonuclease domain-containing protein n=1 Tax=Rhodotorula toruloides TaxID=5286 RepID=A0A0K3CTN4_RHOTO|nr:hypothetical protein RTG_02675 [Rhodotorula toruloides ATCC 204091]PRQ71210.1 hypothetical protein AAT19DRAFT_10750 [Rhodotorula toruloides]